MPCHHRLSARPDICANASTSWRSAAACSYTPTLARRPVIVLGAHSGRAFSVRPTSSEADAAHPPHPAVQATASLAVGNNVHLSPQRAEALRSMDGGPGASWDENEATQSPRSARSTGPSSSSRERLPPQKLVKADDAWAAFEARLEADLQTVATTLVAIVGVIVFWRGVWSLLDYYLGDNPIGDVACVLAGLSIIMYIRLAGLKVGSFWPSG